MIPIGDAYKHCNCSLPHLNGPIVCRDCPDKPGGKHKKGEWRQTT
jgi:hypothetical protein